MKIFKSKTSNSNRLSSHPSELGQPSKIHKRPQAHEELLAGREMYRTQHLYNQEQSHRSSKVPATDSNEDSEEFISFLNGYIKQLKTDPKIKTSKLEYVRDKVQQQHKFNRRMMKMIIAMQRSLTERQNELEKIMQVVDELAEKQNRCLNDTKKLRPRRMTDKYRVEDFLKGSTLDELNVTDDSEVEYRMERNHTEAADRRIDRRNSTIHSREQSKLPIQDLQRFISQSINVRKKK